MGGFHHHVAGLKLRSESFRGDHEASTVRNCTPCPPSSLVAQKLGVADLGSAGPFLRYQSGRGVPTRRSVSETAPAHGEVGQLLPAGGCRGDPAPGLIGPGLPG